MNGLQAALQWLALGQQVVAAGAGVLGQIQDVLKANGIEADTAALEQVIADADRRKALAERDARPATAAELGIHAGSTGD